MLSTREDQANGFAKPCLAQVKPLDSKDDPFFRENRLDRTTIYVVRHCKRENDCR
jgi:hypothetical protein